MKYNPKVSANCNSPQHHRRSIRLKGYDYSQSGLYFITICCQNRAHLFGEIIDGEMVLNEAGRIAFDTWQETEQIRDNCKIHEFVIMPNHIHGIIEITHSKGSEASVGKFKSPKQTIGSIVRGFKISTIKRIKELICTGELQFAPTIESLDFKIWQRNYWERIIRDEKEYEYISNYIINNPIKWENDKLRVRANSNSPHNGKGELQFAPTRKR